MSTVDDKRGYFSCTFEVPSAIPVLKNAYGGSMKNVLHVGPETCSVVSKLLSEGETEAWGLEPYEIEDADRHCKTLVHKGIVRVADIKFPFPYRPKSFSHVIVSDAFDYLSPKYMNKTLPELARVSADGIIIFTGSPSQRRAKIAQFSKFGRPVEKKLSAEPAVCLKFALCIWVMAMAKGGEMIAGGCTKGNFWIAGCR
ncbi:S-adenosyl-L-methionine-dependent methyltransferase [Vigna unguiculata]|uniref:S-adenosyl-L-methionine-dependent methyltransferase n=1 Tax=Vigna unguiculata TaxID=3917 RepID=A0A4D6KYV1_VIGUN|nr:S-adenosyl-L-methionine-dependent methyltransferase [Vigna unguiculata]